MAFNPNIPGYSTQGKSFSRTAAFPLESYEIWTDWDALVAYAANTDPAKDPSYIGQKVAFIDTANNRVVHYGIEIDGSLKELGADKMGVEALTAADEGKIPQAFKVIDVEESGEEGAEDYQPEVSHVEIRWVDAKLTDTVTTVSSKDGSATVTKEGDNYDIKVNFPEIEFPEDAEYAIRKEEKEGFHGVYHLTKDGTDVDVAIEVPVTDLSDYAKSTDLVDYSVTVSTENVEDHSVKHYVFSQCGKEIAHVDVPKDLVVESGRVEVKTEAGAWGEAGTYIVLEIANQTDPIYVNAKDLVDVYTVADTSTVDMTITGTEIKADVKISAVEGNSLVAKEDGLYVNAPVLPTSEDVAVDKQYVTAVDQKDGKVTVSRKQISYNDLADLPTIPGESDFGILDIEGKDAIQVTGDQDKIVELVLDNSGNVTLSQSDAGLKAEVVIPELALGTKTNATVADDTYIHEVVASVAVKDHTVTPTVIDVVTKKAWDKINNAGEGETAKRLITESEINKLAKLNLDNGEITISGSVNASQVKELYKAVVDIVTKTPADGDLDSDAEGDQLGLNVAKGAQVNVIEEIALPGAVLDIANKRVDIPAATAEKYGVIKHSLDHVATTERLGFIKSAASDAENKVYVDENGVGQVNKINVNTLVQTEGEFLILNGGNAALN